ncbi:uncharacterized protein LOC103697723 [Phoenix dactylifera]|uniref:Uncharacterized protein LOC103697723 n=1 Tax=Phoenix dactylifera TaxID=42345 RepID=A0A8B7BIT9_PHODC|nr:uncharacterized protein LOC103697723 [Phoenix dactylifera]XP_008777862.1 uncharacterized protein LOC103697723 [Phoenix dactylifera]
MARSARGRCRLSSRQFRWTPYPVPSHCWKIPEKEGSSKKTPLALEKRDWEDATCSVCMEYPHNAVLLLCSSHDKGCRPYMCGTSYRHSNCLDQFKKAYTRVNPTHDESTVDNQGLGLAMSGWSASQKSEVIELACPLCRGQVKGWTVVEAAREYLNNKKRSCMQDNCSFMGTYKELHKHVRSEHPSAKPREVDPVLEQKWRTLELERERQDVISTIRSSMPRAVVFGDYVIDVNNSDLEPNDEAGGADGEYGGGRDISRSILYFLLREGTRLMRLHRENVLSEGREEDSVYAPSMNGAAADIIAAYSSEGDDVISHGRGAGTLRSERRRRRRRRRRSRDRSVFDVS